MGQLKIKNFLTKGKRAASEVRAQARTEPAVREAVHPGGRTHTHMDLLCGIGGFSAAAARLGMVPVVAGDYHPPALRVFRANYPEVWRTFTDLHTADDTLFPKDTTLLTCGFPCQPFSTRGKREAMDDPRSSVIARLCEVMATARPRAVLLENVPGLRSAGNGEALKTILSMVAAAGYVALPPIVLDASDFGLVARRRRLYIVCFRADLHECAVAFCPPPEVELAKKRHPRKAHDATSSSGDEQDGATGRASPFRTVHDPAADADVRLHLSEGSLAVARERETRRNHKYVTVLRPSSTRIPTLTKSYNSVFVPLTRTDRCPCRDATVGQERTQRGGRAKPSNSSKTLSTRQNTPCSGLRRLSTTELLRCMGFPGTYNMPGAHSNCRSLIGNAVPVPVVENLMRRMLEAMEGLDEDEARSMK